MIKIASKLEEMTNTELTALYNKNQKKIIETCKERDEIKRELEGGLNTREKRERKN